MHVLPFSYKIGACPIFVKKFSAKNKQIFEFGLVQPGPKRKKKRILAGSGGVGVGGGGGGFRS